ncbi:MAG: PEGA domain-containing protein [Desulfobacterales bacterium]
MKKSYPPDKKEKTSAFPRIVPNQLIVDRYMTQFEIRNDGMTSVYMAFDMQKERNVALMLMPEELNQKLDILEDLQLQIDSVTDLDHSNIAQFYSLYLLKDKVFAIMEYVHGKTLAEHLTEKGGKLSVEEALALLKQIGAALDYAHSRTPSIYHLGLKPQNILLTEKNQVKIADFGIANILSSPAAKIPGRENIETMAYLAPEQIGEKETGPWTDVYSLSAIAYEMVSGKPPFHSEELHSQIMNQKPKKIEGVPDPVNNALLKGLSKESSKRPESPGQFVAMFSREKPFRKPKQKKIKIKPKLVFSVIGILLLLALGAAGLFFYQKGPKETGHKIERPSVEVTTPTRAKDPPPRETNSKEALSEKQNQRAETAGTEKFLTGEISVVSIPREVAVYLDGIQKGITPVTLKNIEPGVYRLTLQKEGYEYWDKDIEISAQSSSEVVVNLSPLYGSFDITSIPPSAEVYLDGVKQGVTPLKIDQIKKGFRKVEVTKAGYETWSENVQVIPGGIVALDAELKVAMGSVNITSKPDNADIYISGIKHGSTPMVIKIEKGVRKIELKKPGYETWEQDIQIAEGDIRTISAFLDPIKGSLTITSIPENAEVYISGRMLGKTPLVLKEIKLGQTLIELKKECYAPEAKNITIRSVKASGISFTLKPVCGELSIKSEPLDAKLYIDGVYVGRTPGELKKVAKGQHAIRVTKEKYLDWTTTFQIQPAERKQITARLKPAPPQTGTVWIETVTGMEFVWVKGGCYTMGSRSGEPGKRRDEFPHEVCIDGMWVGKYEVTQGQWKKVLGSNPAFFGNKTDYPVESTSWSNIQAFIKKLNEMNQGKHTFRLPTEAEWEYACKSGGKGERFCGGDQIDRIAWHKENCDRTPHPVGQKEPNRAGLYDMSGNVSEWVEDTYAVDAYKKHGKKNPVHKDAGPDRVIRGGNWMQKEEECRSAARNFFPEKRGKFNIGFRLVKNH